MHTVVEMPTFVADAKAAGLYDEEQAAIVTIIASNPTASDLIVGTGGARKLRIAGRGKGKSGGFRAVTYYAADDLPVFLLALIDKGERTNLSQAERNELRRTLGNVADAYRRRIAPDRGGRS